MSSDMSSEKSSEKSSNNSFDHYDDSEEDQDEIVTFVDRPSNNEPRAMKAYRRTLQRQVYDKKTTEAMIREALSVYDIERGSGHMSPAVMASLERIFGLEKVQWPSAKERVSMVALKVFVALKNLLRTYGYGFFGFYGENGKGRLEIMPAPSRSPPELPDWLHIDFLVPKHGVEFKIIPEGRVNPRIANGDALYRPVYGILPEANQSVGTFGTVMKTVSISSRTEVHVALTAAHILDVGDEEMIIQSTSANVYLNLRVSNTSKIIGGRPRRRLNKKPNFRDDCAFLIIDPSSLEQFDHRITNLNTHYYERLDDETETPGDPVSTSRKISIMQTLSINPLTVFKQGATSGLTMGYFVQVLENPPDGWYEDMQPNLRREMDEADENEWLGLVRWIDHNHPFSMPGDSGSLVYSKEGNITIPWGIHVGAPASYPGHSVFISIETFCFEAENEGWELKFTEL